MGKLKLGDTIAYDKAMIDYQLIPQDFSRFVGKLVLMDDEAVGAETPSWLEVVQLVTYHYNGDVTIMTDEGSQTIPKHKLVKHSGNYIALYAVKEVSEEVKESAVIVSAEYTKAVTLTRSIKAKAEAANDLLYEACQELKVVHDERLYKELGYSNFGDYCEAETGFSRQYVLDNIKIANLGEDFVNSSLHLGKKKLIMLGGLSASDRQALMETHDVENMTVKELKEAKAEIKKLKAEKMEMVEQHTSEQDEFLQKIDKLQGHANRLEEERLTKHQEWLNAMDEITELTVKKTKLEERVQELENRPPETVTQTLYTDNPQKDAEIQSLSQTLQQAKAENEQLQRALQQAQEAQPQEGKNGELDAHFKIFRDALSHIVAILGNPKTPDFLRKQYLSSLTTTFEDYTGIFADDGKEEAPKPKKEKEQKHKYGEYGYVKLTETEYNRLVSEYGEKIIREYITKVDNYCKSNNNKQKYSDYNLVLRDWLRRDNVSKIAKEGGENGNNPWYLKTI